MWYASKLKTEDHKETKVHATRSFFAEFCSGSSIHGVRHFAEKRRHWSERVFWSIAILLSLYLCGTSIGNTYVKWQENLVTISFTEKKISISKIPFPKVTICPENKAHKDKIDLSSFGTNGIAPSNVSAARLERARALGLVCSLFQFYAPGREKFLNESIYDVFIDIAPTLDTTIPSCWWNNRFLPCSDSFVPIMTDEGLCFSFNALNSYELYTKEVAPKMMTSTKPRRNITNWSPESGYTNGLAKDTYPMRTFRTGKFSGLFLFLASSESYYQKECHTEEGFKVSLSMPGEAGQMSKHVYHLPPSESAEIAIKSQFITTSEGLRKYKPEQRQCFYHSERQLRFFQIYTRENCLIECLSNFTKSECGCVKFSMPRDASTQICSAVQVLCYMVAEENIYEASDEPDDITTKSFRSECNCLPSCIQIEYHGEIDRMRFKQNYIIANANVSISRLTVVFKDHQVETLKRVEMQTYVNFLAICGGLMGLFLGISVLSIIEFIYYFTLRLFCNHLSRSQNIVTPFQPRDKNVVFIRVGND